MWAITLTMPSRHRRQKCRLSLSCRKLGTSAANVVLGFDSSGLLLSSLMSMS